MLQKAPGDGLRIPDEIVVSRRVDICEAPSQLLYDYFKASCQRGGPMSEKSKLRIRVLGELQAPADEDMSALKRDLSRELAARIIDEPSVEDFAVKLLGEGLLQVAIWLTTSSWELADTMGRSIIYGALEKAGVVVESDEEPSSDLDLVRPLRHVENHGTELVLA